jgi:hypothetical protein
MGPAAEVTRFGFGGIEYGIDLSKKTAAAFRRKIASTRGEISMALYMY